MSEFEYRIYENNLENSTYTLLWTTNNKIEAYKMYDKLKKISKNKIIITKNFLDDDIFYYEKILCSKWTIILTFIILIFFFVVILLEPENLK